MWYKITCLVVRTGESRHLAFKAKKTSYTLFRAPDIPVGNPSSNIMLSAKPPEPSSWPGRLSYSVFDVGSLVPVGLAQSPSTVIKMLRIFVLGANAERGRGSGETALLGTIWPWPQSELQTNNDSSAEFYTALYMSQRRRVSIRNQKMPSHWNVKLMDRTTCQLWCPARCTTLPSPGYTNRAPWFLQSHRAPGQLNRASKDDGDVGPLAIGTGTNLLRESAVSRLLGHLVIESHRPLLHRLNMQLSPLRKL